MTPDSALVLPPSSGPPLATPVFTFTAGGQQHTEFAAAREWRGHDVDASDWMLDQYLFLYLVTAYHFDVAHTVDLFASRKNAQTAQYFTAPLAPGAIDDTQSCSGCLGRDAFAADWSMYNALYANPPWADLFRLRTRITRDRTPLILAIVPKSTLFGQYGFLRLCADHPIVLPHFRTFKPPDQQPSGDAIGTPPPVVAVLLSGDVATQQSFRQSGPPRLITWPRFIEFREVMLKGGNRLYQLDVSCIAPIKTPAHMSPIYSVDASLAWPFGLPQYTDASARVAPARFLARNDHIPAVDTTALLTDISPDSVLSVAELDCAHTLALAVNPPPPLPSVLDDSELSHVEPTVPRYTTGNRDTLDDVFQYKEQLLQATMSSLLPSHTLPDASLCATAHHVPVVPGSYRSSGTPLVSTPLWTCSIINHWWVPMILDTGAVASLIADKYEGVLYEKSQCHMLERTFGPVGADPIKSTAVVDLAIVLPGEGADWRINARFHVVHHPGPLLLCGMDLLRDLRMQILLSPGVQERSLAYSAYQPETLVRVTSTQWLRIQSQRMAFSALSPIGHRYRSTDAPDGGQSDNHSAVTFFHWSGDSTIQPPQSVCMTLSTSATTQRSPQQLLTVQQLHELGERYNVDWNLTLSPDDPFEQVLHKDLDVNLDNQRLALVALVQILRNKRHAFTFDGHAIGSCNWIPFTIHLRCHLPPRSPDRRYSPDKRAALATERKKMFELCRWEEAPPDATFASHPVVVTYPDKPPRIAVDYRLLNQYSEPDAYPFPPVDEQVRWLATNFLYISGSDAVKGFYQIAIEDINTRNYLAICLPDGTVRPTHMPYGHKNSPQHFVRVMDRVLGDEKRKHLSAFVDDIHCKGSSIFDALCGIAAWLDLFIKAHIYLRLDKSHWLFLQLAVLGYLVTAEGLRPDPEKLKAILDWEIPDTVEDLWSFWGLIGFYSGLVKDFSLRFAALFKPIAQALTAYVAQRRAAPVTTTAEHATLQNSNRAARPVITVSAKEEPVLANVRREMDPFVDPAVSKKHDASMKRFMRTQNVEHTDEFKQAFTDAKAVFASPLVIAPPLDGFPYILMVDSCYKGMGLALEQVYADGTHHPVLFCSRKLQSAEANLAPVELECAGLIWALNKTRQFVEGAMLTVVTDHKALLWIQNYRGLNPKLQRWAADLSFWEDKMVILHRPGRFNVVADALSRVNMVYAVDTTDPIFDTIRSHLARPDAQAVSEPMVSAAWKQLQSGATLPNWQLVNGLLSHAHTSKDAKHVTSWRYYVPTTYRITLLEKYHDTTGHQGYQRIYAELARTFWWPAMRLTVRTYAHGCDTCQCTKDPTVLKNGLLQPLPIARGRWENIAMDFVGPLPLTAHDDNAILVVVDQFSKAAHLYPVSLSLTAQQAAQLFVTRYFPLHGMPRAIVSDRDPRFTAEFWQTFCTSLGCYHTPSTSAHQQADGQSERMIRTTVTILRAYVNERHTDWDKWLPVAEYALNAFPHAGTKESPYRAWLGYTPQYQWPLSDSDRRTISADADEFVNTLQSIKDSVTANLQAYKDNMKLEYDSRHRAQSFRVGDYVRLDILPMPTHHTSKLDDRYVVCKVKKVLDHDNYELELPYNFRRCYPIFHVSRLRAYSTPITGQKQCARPGPVDEEGEYEVEDILDERVRYGKTEYLVKWKDWPRANATWEREGNLDNTVELVQRFRERKARPSYFVAVSRSA